MFSVKLRWTRRSPDSSNTVQAVRASSSGFRFELQLSYEPPRTRQLPWPDRARLGQQSAGRRSRASLPSESAHALSKQEQCKPAIMDFDV